MIKKASVLLVLSATAAMFAPANTAQAVIYCEYVDYPAHCVVRPGVVLRVRPVVRAVTPGVGAPGVGIRAGTPGNRGGPVNRVGRR